MPPKGSTQRGDPSGRFFGDFLIGEKVTRVQGGAPASRGVQRGQHPSHFALLLLYHTPLPPAIPKKEK